MVARGKRHGRALMSSGLARHRQVAAAGGGLFVVALNLGMMPLTEWNVRINLCSIVYAAAAITIAG
jgi:hypothetical protein